MTGVSKEYGGGLDPGTSGMMETTMMEGEEFYTPETAANADAAAGGDWPGKIPTSQLCRVCANPNEYLIPIFEGEGLEHELGTKIQKHLPIEVTESDTLPLHMCYNCASTLIAWNDMVVGCVEADKKLRQLQQEEENEEDYDDKAVFYDTPAIDSDTADDPIEPSTSAAPARGKRTVKEKKPRLRPPAKAAAASKSRLSSPPKAQEDASAGDSANERCPQDEEDACDSKHDFEQTETDPAEAVSWEPSNVQEISRLFRSRLVLVDVMSKLDSSQDSAHKGKQPFPCASCDRVFWTQFALNRHMSSCRHITQVSTKIDSRKEETVAKEGTRDAAQLVAELIIPEIEVPYAGEIVTIGIESGVPEDVSTFEPAREEVAMSSFEPQPTSALVSYLEAFAQQDLLSDFFDVQEETVVFEFDAIVSDMDGVVVEVKDPLAAIEGETVAATECDPPPPSPKRGSKKSACLTMEEEVCDTDGVRQKQYRCSICDKVSSDRSDIEEHLSTHTLLFLDSDDDEELIKEDDVPQEFPDENGYTTGYTTAGYTTAEESCAEEDRVKKKWSTREYQCADCETVLHRKRDLVEHLKSHRPGYKRRCRKQVTKGPRVKNVLCSSCGKTFFTAQQLDVHMKAHEKNQKLRGFDLVDVERARVTVDGRRAYRCEQCGKHVFTRYSYADHLRTHSDEKPYACATCGARFSTMMYLGRHRRAVHERVRKHKCDICDRRFAYRRAMEEHRRTHTGERPHMCSACGKAFKTLAALYIHGRTHDVPQYECASCGKKYKDRAKLRKHQFKHTGGWPYTCRGCGRGFTNRREAREHENIHKSATPFNCTLCGARFKMARYLRKHIKANHSSERDDKFGRMVEALLAADRATADGSPVDRALPQYLK